MNSQPLKHIAALSLLAACLASPSALYANLTINPGWDLFWTVDAKLPNPGIPGPTFLDFTGVPLVNYDFGGSFGVQYVGNTDTIIQRLDTATIPTDGSTTIGIKLDALQLADVADGYYVTLDQSNPTYNHGLLTIAADGTWSDHLSVNFDLYTGAFGSGTYLGGGVENFTSSGIWSSTPGAGAVLINGVNNELDGTDHLNDFYLVGLVTESTIDGAVHMVAETPEPSPAWLALLGTGLWLMRRKRNRR